MEEQLLFSNREEFRRWLLKNHHIHQGFCMVFGNGGKIKTLKPDEALEEALCFGWIDGLIKSIDDEKYLKMPLSVRKTYTGFYLAAKKEETRVNRIKKIVEQLNKNNKSPMF